MTLCGRAIVRRLGDEFLRAISTSGLGPPSTALARGQHAAYCGALESCGLAITYLDPDPAYPDGVFVEDTAVIDGKRALITRPGHAARRGEAPLIAVVLRDMVADLAVVEEPGTVDGGDVCDADDVFFVGRSARTNDEGIEQLRRWAAVAGKRTVAIDLPPGMLHLKSGLSYLGDRTFVAAPSLAADRALNGYRTIGVAAEEAYAANCVRVNGRVLVPAGYPHALEALRVHGLQPLPLDMSEFAKMDGGLSCLSLRL